jgi:hypothetical protein
MFRFLLRFLGLTGLMVAATGTILLAAEPGGLSWPSFRAAWQGQGDQLAVGSAFAVAGGLAVALLVLLLELLTGTRVSAGRRSAFGLNVGIQVALASALLVGINVWSFDYYRRGHYVRWDCTRDRSFTLPPQVAAELKKLRGETTVVVYQQHKTFGRFSDEPPDDFDAAAESKVVEKVADLVDQLREFGPQFRVVVLDKKDKKFKRQLAAEEAEFPGLTEAIKSAPESSIFFCAGKNIQRLGFQEFYQLDKTASQEAGGGRGNLVLLAQGVEPFVRRVLAIEEKKPRVAIAVSHPLLSTDGQVDFYTLSGLRKTLTKNGFDVRDILLNRFVGRRGNRSLRLEKSAMSIEEGRYERTELQLGAIRFQIDQYRREVEGGKDLLKLLQSNIPQDDLDRQLSASYGRRVTMTPEMRQKNIAMLSERIPEIGGEIATKQEKERQLEAELEKLQSQESVSEGQRQSDLKKKMGALLADCDVLIVARMTIIDTADGHVVPSMLHQLDDQQLAAVKEFMKAGKPVLFCFGPTNPEPGEPTPSDNLESLLGEVGFSFAPQAVLFDAETEAYAANQAQSFGRGAGTEEIPALEFPVGEVRTGTLAETTGSEKTNPLSLSLQLVQHGAGQPLNLRMRYPRPVYFHSLRGPSNVAPSFLMTARASWNEDQPYPTEERPIPRFEPPKPDDPTRGTRNEKRRGPFPIGVAVETTLPITWYEEKFGAEQAASMIAASHVAPGGIPIGLAVGSLTPPESYSSGVSLKPESNPRRVRLAAIGHGGWFSGPSLSPPNETLILHSLNWLLVRDDRLPRAEKVWQYPRVDLSERDKFLWLWGAVAGLPALFAYLGFVVLLRRRTR